MRLSHLFEAEQVKLPKTVIKAFEDLGDEQRGNPESAMLRAQEAMGGGVLSFCIEHIGDLTHRMSHMVGWSSQSAGHGMVDDKIKKTLRVLTQEYGFEREVEVNFKNNANYRKEPLGEFTKKAYAALDKYAAAHKKLVVYNRAQWLGREAAVSLGERKFALTIKYLRELDSMCKTWKIWNQHALSYRLDAKGEPIPYKG